MYLCICIVLPAIVTAFLFGVFCSTNSFFFISVTGNLIWTLFSEYVNVRLRMNTHSDNCVHESINMSFKLFFHYFFAVVVLNGVETGYMYFTCQHQECCTDNWITPNISGLDRRLHEQVHRQPLAIETIVGHLRGHIEGKPSKALVLSLHGPTGTGKTFVSKLIIEHLFVKGMESRYVHVISVTKDFSDPDKVEEYKTAIKRVIEAAVKECPRSMFVLDEVENFPRELLDMLVPYVDTYDIVDGTNYRQSVFILLSNSNNKNVTDYLSEMKTKNVGRRDMQLKPLEQIILKTLQNNTSGLWNSSLVKSSLVTAFVPFLPLERKHVTQCIKDGLVTLYEHEHLIDDVMVEEIADQMTYSGDFITDGCERVLEKIDIVVR